MVVSCIMQAGSIAWRRVLPLLGKPAARGMQLTVHANLPSQAGGQGFCPDRTESC